MRALSLACIAAVAALVGGAAAAQGSDDACVPELQRTYADVGQISSEVAQQLIAITVQSRTGLSCRVYEQMVDIAGGALLDYLQRPERNHAAAFAAARAGRIAEARGAYGNGAQGSIEVTDLHDAALLAVAASDYPEAGRLFGEAARRSASNQEARQSYLTSQASALANAGEFHLDTAALDHALAIYRQLSLEIPRTDSRWHGLQARLANAVFVQAEQTADESQRMALLANATELYRSVSEVRQAFESPREWARIQYNLGTALVELGARRGNEGRADIEASVEAYRNALAVYSVERQPRLWANTLIGVSRALLILSVTEQNLDRRLAHIRQARDYSEQVVSARTRETAPFEWATAQANLTRAYFELGRLSTDPAASRDSLRNAISAAQAALSVLTFEQTPDDWARVQGNLGDALLASVQHDSSAIPAAIAAFRAQQRQITREADPWQWGRANVSIALAHMLAAERGDQGQLSLARTAAQEAIDAFETSGMPQAAGDADFARRLLAALPPQ